MTHHHIVDLSLLTSSSLDDDTPSFNSDNFLYKADSKKHNSKLQTTIEVKNVKPKRQFSPVTESSQTGGSYESGSTEKTSSAESITESPSSSSLEKSITGSADSSETPATTTQSSATIAGSPAGKKGTQGQPMTLVAAPTTSPDTSRKTSRNEKDSQTESVRQKLSQKLSSASQKLSKAVLSKAASAKKSAKSNVDLEKGKMSSDEGEPGSPVNSSQMGRLNSPTTSSQERRPNPPATSSEDRRPNSPTSSSKESMPNSPATSSKGSRPNSPSKSSEVEPNSPNSSEMQPKSPTSSESGDDKSLSQQLGELEPFSKSLLKEGEVRDETTEEEQGPLDPLIAKFLIKAKKESLSNSLSGIKFIEKSFLDDANSTNHSMDDVCQSMIKLARDFERDLMKLFIELDTIHDLTIFLAQLEQVAIYDCMEPGPADVPGLPNHCGITLQLMKKMSTHVTETLLKMGALSVGEEGATESKILAEPSEDMNFGKCSLQ